ncbi:MAG: radical SAM protein [Candidatus Schekmanbacteria bacterium]|nr:MAG: radical SAM protein [Candidatus Schekmanbacteria bacterium]
MEFTPQWIAWEITGKCDLNCIHCRAKASFIENPNELKTEEIFHTMDNIASFSKPVIILTGGEPLLREDVFDIIAYGRKKGFRMAMSPNGHSITEEKAKMMKEAGIQMISISLDGSTKEVHDNFRRQEGSFEGTMKGIETAKKYGIDFQINSSFSKRNQDEIPKMLELSKRLGAKAWFMFMIVPTGRGKEIIDELIDSEDYEKILNWFYEEQKKKEIFMRPVCAPQYFRIKAQRAKADGLKVQGEGRGFRAESKGCLGGQTFVFISRIGDVSPCGYFPAKAGNIREASFEEIWKHSKLFKDLRNWKSYKGKCGICEYNPVCGGCRARALALKGDYMEEEPYCPHIPARIKVA